ncbi:hypothetical protein WS70_27835 [Burkholderia mayonis]|uniref:Uncharacterized protein n=1 Tax=Burkholderia mayonis TaxID=1385591 RepID=A0A1B4FP99_9BURK|nr:hypothetical protein WS70_27835 [Burkholderia mayonis]KVE41044.1 hypothetical protein WS69_05760 [Burkholderia sp. BDU5]KVE47797.1 hypothetical protein WS70_24925 [Burkholderia mayonis]
MPQAFDTIAADRSNSMRDIRAGDGQSEPVVTPHEAGERRAAPMLGPTYTSEHRSERRSA